MALIYNGIKCNTIEELEVQMIDLSADQKLLLRNDFNGITNEPPIVSQKEKDYNKYIKRASVKDKIIAEMASENMERVRNGVWAVSDLIALTQDPELKNVLDDVSSLSFELAAQKVAGLTNVLVTPEIKNVWISKLMSHFYNT